MKKVLAFLLSAAMLLALAACGGNQGGADTGTGGEGGEALHVGMICESLGTQSFNDDVLLGLETAVAELGIKEDHIEIREVSDAANSLRTLISQGCTFMVVPSSSYRDAMVEVAEEYPDVKFLYLAAAEEGVDNIMSVEYKENEAAFLAGALAASLSKSGKIGTVLAVQEPLQLRYQYGYMAGAYMIDPACEVTAVFTNSYSDTNIGKEMATALYQQGADYVSCYAGACNLGVFAAADEAGDGSYCLGAATGQFDKNPNKIVASVVKPINDAIVSVLKAYVENGTFQGGTVSVWGLKEEGVGLRYTTMNDDLLASIPQEVLDKVEELKGQVSDGTIQVPGTAEEFEAFKAGR